MRFAGKFMTQGGPDFGGMSQNNIEMRGREKSAVHAAESQVNQYGLKSVADVRAAEMEAEAMRVQGQQAGQAAMFDGLMNGISGIASAGIQKWGAPSKAYGGTGSTGINTPGKYGSFDKTLGGLVKPS